MTVTRHGRFCLPINAFELESVVLSVARDEPTKVVVFEVNLCDFLMEWALRPNDVLFLTKVEETGQVGMIRGCSVERGVDAAGRAREMTGNIRRVTVRFDPKQYAADGHSGTFAYAFDLVLQRRRETNSFHTFLVNVQALAEKHLNVLLGVEPPPVNDTADTTFPLPDTFTHTAQIAATFPGVRVEPCAIGDESSHILELEAGLLFVLLGSNRYQTIVLV